MCYYFYIEFNVYRSQSSIMSTKHILNILILIACVLILIAPLHSSLAETSSLPGHTPDTSSGSMPPFYQQEESGNKAEPDEDAPRGEFSISISSDLVTLQVLVTDDKGNVITGLKPGNFLVYEDKVKQEITNFSPIEANITAVLLVEMRKYSSYAVDQIFIDQIYNIIYTFVQKLQRGDWVGVIGYDIKPKLLCDFTQNPQKILDTLRTFSFPAIQENNLFDAVIDAIDRTQEIDGKVAIILVSTGFNSFSGNTFEDTLKMCRSSNAVIYSISMGQYYRLLLEAYGYTNMENSLDYQMADNHLKYISEYTGGGSYFPRHDSELPAIVNNISTLLRSQYSIGYISTNTKKDDKFRKIQVEVQADMMKNGKPVKFKVKTRKGYIPRP
jgi:Ca-activated chloride channel family protein